jgi:NAD+ synthase (glutamine-hydrolysing)
LKAYLERLAHRNESDIGMSYTELSVYGRLRKEDKLGPYGAWSILLYL